MMPLSKVEKTFRLKEHFKGIYIYLPPRALAGLEPKKKVKLFSYKLQAVFISYYSRELMEIN